MLSKTTEGAVMDLVMAYVLMVAFQQNPDNEPVSHYRLPPHGTVRKGVLFGFFGDAKSIKAVSAIQIDNRRYASFKSQSQGVSGPDSCALNKPTCM